MLRSHAAAGRGLGVQLHLVLALTLRLPSRGAAPRRTNQGSGPPGRPKIQSSRGVSMG